MTTAIWLLLELYRNTTYTIVQSRKIIGVNLYWSNWGWVPQTSTNWALAIAQIALCLVLVLVAKCFR
jgi:hypothetical protein